MTITRFATLLFPVAALFYFLGAGAFKIAGRDTFIFLDGIYRVMSGQVPNVDFSSQLGPALFFIPAIFLGPEQIRFAIPSLLIFSTLFAAFLTATTFDLHRKSEATVSVVALFLATLIIVSPARIGDGLDDIFLGNLTWHRIYSDICNAYLLIVFAWVSCRVFAPEQPVPQPILAAFTIALATQYMFYLKVTYAIAGAMLLAPLLLGHKRSALNFLALFVLFQINFFGLFYIFFGEVLRGYVSDILFSIGASDRTSVLTWIGDGLRLLNSFGPQLSFVLAVLLFLDIGVRLHRPFALLMVAMMTSLFLDVYDDGPVKAAPLLGLILAFLTVQVRSVLPMAGFTLFGLVFLNLFPIATNSLLAIAKYRESALSTDGHEGRVGIIYSGRHGDTDLQTYIDSGIVALDEAWESIGSRAGCARDPRVFVFDISNPFALLLGSPPAKTRLLWIHDDLTLSREAAPDFKDLIGNADLIMVPKKAMWHSARRALISTYQADLEGLNPIYSSADWTIYIAPGANPCL